MKSWSWRKRMVWGCGGTLAGVLLMGVIGVAIGIWLLKSPPQQWRESQRRLEQHSQAQLDRQARSVENRLTGEITSVRRTGSSHPPTRTIEIGLEEANAWLDRRLDEWARSQQIDLPQALDQLTLGTREDHLVLSGQIHSAGFSQVLSIGFHVNVEPAGPMRLRITSITAGRLPIAFEMAWKRSGLAKSLPDQAKRLVQQANGKGAELTAVWPIDQRQIRLLNIDPQPEAVRLTIRTEKREP